MGCEKVCDFQGRTFFVHNRQRRHTPFHKNGERLVKCRCLLNGCDVPERPNPKLLDRLSSECRLGYFLVLNAFKHHSRTTLMPQQA